jgi:hypothetical protein
MPAWRRPSPALVVASVALFVALGGVAFAATGGNFILGTSNTADQQTSLVSTVGGNSALRVENAATASASYGVVGKITAAGAAANSAGVKGTTAATNPAAAAVVGTNLGGGPGLSAVVNSGAPPLSVNSTTKVANLNADQLDGIDGSAFLQNGDVGAVSLTPVGDLATDAAPYAAVPLVIHRMIDTGTLSGSATVDIPIYAATRHIFVTDAWVVGLSPVVQPVDWSLRTDGGADLTAPLSLALLQRDVARVYSFAPAPAPASRVILTGDRLVVRVTNTSSSDNSANLDVYVLALPSS